MVASLIDRCQAVGRLAWWVDQVGVEAETELRAYRSGLVSWWTFAGLFTNSI